MEDLTKNSEMNADNSPTQNENIDNIETSDQEKEIVENQEQANEEVMSGQEKETSDIATETSTEEKKIDENQEPEKEEPTPVAETEEKVESETDENNVPTVEVAIEEKKEEQQPEESKEQAPEPENITQEKEAEAIAKTENLLSEVASKISDSEMKAFEGLDNNPEHEAEEIEEEITENYLAYTREQLLSAIEELVNLQVDSVKNKISLIKVAFYSKTNELKKSLEEKFLAEGGVKEEFQYVADTAEEQFKKALTVYREKRQKYLENIERAKLENLEKKMVILEELKTLINSEETLKKTYDEFKNLQERWREIGAVPRAEVNNLWRNYHFLIEKFFDKVKINRELKMLDLKKNLEQKVELCEKVEELLLETSITEATKKLQTYRDKWREIGPVPSEKNEEIWERFSNAAEQIDTRRKEYYESMREELDRNLIAKTTLCEKAEELLTKELKTVKDWNDTTVEFDDLFKIWKTIGNTPKNTGNEIWDRFKSSLDIFFGNKKEYFEKLKEEQNHNYNLKLDICKQAEEIAHDRSDWKRATGELLQLQKQWKEIGNISRKLSDKLWLRFRAACDEFFTQKELFFADARASESENLAKKEDILKRLKEYQFTDDNNENLSIIKEFQREWMEVGFVPIADKERIQNEFRTLVNQLFEKLKISVQESQRQNYKTRIENLSNKTSNFVSHERNDLQNKIQKLKSNLQLWENNLGFLSQSKQADILKQEFERKMQSARNEIVLLEMKLKMLLEAKDTKQEPKPKVKEKENEKPEESQSSNTPAEEPTPDATEAENKE